MDAQSDALEEVPPMEHDYIWVSIRQILVFSNC